MSCEYTEGAYKHPDNKVLLSNCDMEHYNSYKSIVEEYRKTPNALMVYVKREAYWENGMLDPSLFALCTQDKGKDHTQFWNFFDEHRRKKLTLKPKESIKEEEMTDSPKFQFSNVVVVMDDQIGVIVKTWGASKNRGIHYEVYVRSFNAILEFNEDEIKHYVYSKELFNDEHIFYA